MQLANLEIGTIYQTINVDLSSITEQSYHMSFYGLADWIVSCSHENLPVNVISGLGSHNIVNFRVPFWHKSIKTKVNSFSDGLQVKYWKEVKHNCRVFLQRQLWIINYYVKSLSNNLSNENIMTGVSREMIFKKQFILAF